MNYDYSKLIGTIYEKFGSQKAFAESIGMSGSNLSSKLSGKVAFTQRDIENIINRLNLDADDIAQIFFKTKNSKC